MKECKQTTLQNLYDRIHVDIAKLAELPVPFLSMLYVDCAPDFTEMPLHHNHWGEVEEKLLEEQNLLNSKSTRRQF